MACKGSGFDSGPYESRAGLRATRPGAPLIQNDQLQQLPDDPGRAAVALRGGLLVRAVAGVGMSAEVLGQCGGPAESSRCPMAGASQNPNDRGGCATLISDTSSGRLLDPSWRGAAAVAEPVVCGQPLCRTKSRHERRASATTTSRSGTLVFSAIDRRYLLSGFLICGRCGEEQVVRPCQDRRR